MGDVSLSTSVRAPAVAGLFYPDDADELRAVVGLLLDDAPSYEAALPRPRALIVPHAGLRYSGPVAAAAYRLLSPWRTFIRRVVMIGPSHRVPFAGIAVPQADAFATPLGEVRIDAAGRSALLARGDVSATDAPHALEHCLEVQLPFLQTVLDDFTVLPLVVGSATPEYVASVLADVWNDAHTLALASSDLSHYLPYESAQSIDSDTARAIVARRTDLSHEQACGATGVNGLLHLARQRNLHVTEIARNNSGDTSGDTARVVGYGAFAIHEARP